ncbi:MAG: efflux RND transporter periplasmic adaptor subunit [Acidaminococcaceae bacterium]|jgi:membrane fusion protein (multidrug efflux system)|nr:efflux RND transporter periplasmic adaptor subunit [Acidaminococcaceae bacterium]MCI2109877.1 efflux RND transporter periplasmic adaptor subunit [Acidaminococcaceae bacterium]
MISKKKILTMGLACLFVINLAGCGKKQAQTGAKEVNVKAMKVIKRDTPLTYDYTGFVEAKDEVQIKSRVTGTIVQKLVNGGDVVEAGQLLYVIDPRNYQNSVLQAQANLANAQANLANVQRDQARYQTLYDQGAVAKQTLDNYNMQLQQAQGSVAAQEALVASAQVDMGETNIVAPFAGKVDTNCLNEGTVVTAQTTVLTSISNSNPMRVKFSLAENDYLKLMNGNTANGGELKDITLQLSDGSVYPQKGTVNQVDRSVDSTTGTLTLKAQFPNPTGVLLPGMFARITVVGSTRPNAILIPQRAVTDLMYKHFVNVINSENKIEMREVKLGVRIGRLWMVESGLDGTETIVVEGTQKVAKGSSVKPEMITEKDLDTGDTKSN